MSWSLPGTNRYGPPYLDRSLAGFGPGFGIGIDRFRGPFALAVEFTTARIEADLVGRSVPGGDLRGTGVLRDDIFSVLAGVRTTAPGLSVVGLAGLGFASAGASVRSTGPARTEHDWPLAFTGGMDFVGSPTGRLALLVSARYTYRHRGEFARALEVGPHIVRVGAGVRIRLGS